MSPGKEQDICNGWIMHHVHVTNFENLLYTHTQCIYQHTHNTKVFISTRTNTHSHCLQGLLLLTTAKLHKAFTLVGCLVQKKKTKIRMSSVHESHFDIHWSYNLEQILILVFLGFVSLTTCLIHPCLFYNL